jgi:hypothetical protein
MKTKRIKTTIALLGFFTLVLSSCEKNYAESKANLFEPVLLTSPDGVSGISVENLLNALGSTPDLTPDESGMLIKMRDEEKLSRDVYSYLAKKWSHPVFFRISEAENTHLSAVNSLLKFYGSPDTIISDRGVFSDNEVQDLYNELTGKGEVSINDAFKTGALIEEMDIKDLQDALSENINANIKMVFENLERGSRNHLRAFNRQLTFRGVSYVPVYLTQDEFNKIINSPVETGNRYRMHGRFRGR